AILIAIPFAAGAAFLFRLYQQKSVKEQVDAFLQLVRADIASAATRGIELPFPLDNGTDQITGKQRPGLVAQKRITLTAIDSLFLNATLKEQLRLRVIHAVDVLRRTLIRNHRDASLLDG